MAASTQLITDVTTVLTNGPAAATKAKANSPNGPIMDYPGLNQSALLTLQEAKVKLAALLADTDQSTDAANYTLIANVILSLA